MERAQAGFTILETLFVVALIGVISVIAVPQLSNSLAYFRLSGDARSISNAIAVAKMRAASNFSRTRLYVNRSARWHRIESWNKTTSHWTAEGGNVALSSTVNFGFGVVSTAPPNTQDDPIHHAEACTDDGGAAIANTSCVMFNSRGVPISAALAPTSDDAIYVTDGAGVYGVTVAATGMIRTWQTPAVATANWILQ
jgi:prepilin-type N-terminal cleavage/methylation domain-containing protein